MDAWNSSPAFPVPLDILLDVLANLPLSSVLALRRTCKSLCAVTHLRSLWTALFRMHVLDQHIPCPGLALTALADLSAHDLESLTRRALALHHTWTSPDPVPRRKLTLNTPTEPSARIIFLQFLPGRSNRWLISVRMTTKPRTYLLQCWDVASARPQCVAALKHADGPYGGVVLNSDPSSPAMLAMQSAQTETFSIRFDAEDPECGFETEATIDGVRELHLLSGSTLVTRRADDNSALCLWDLADLRQEKVQLLNPSILHPDDSIQAIHLAHDYAVVVRIQSIEIYNVTPRPNLLPVPGAPIAYPLAQFRFQWRTDTLVLREQHMSSLAALSLSSPHPSDTHPRPIHLFVRFAGIYPWPVNVLHHYLLRPNTAYDPTTTTTEYNLPYDPRPCPMHTIDSPVRPFGQSVVALGRYGTALWLDHHAEVFLGPSDRGQRLAGRMVGMGFNWDEHPNGDKRVSSIAGGESIDAYGIGSKIAMTAAMCADPHLALDIDAKSNGASMVFGIRDDDPWTRIAMEEEAGRIAVGHVDGAITLLEY